MFGVLLDGGASKEVTGYSGGRVLIKCKYHTEYRENQKYFCKRSWTYCSDQIKSGAKIEWINSGRFSLFDDTKSAVFSVMIRELTVEDTGTYYCRVDLPRGKDIYTPVKLKVKEDLSYEKSISKTVHVGGDLIVSCKYPESLRSDSKFLCKTGLQRAACSYKASVKESRKYVNEGKFSLYDDGETQMLTVSIRSVTEQDSGEYWCGAEADWKSDHGYKVYFTQIDLTVTDPRVPVSASVPTIYSSSLPTSSSSSSSSSMSTPTSLERGFPAFTVITVSVILLLLLTGVIFLIVILHRRRRTQSPETMTQTYRETNEDYENDPNVLHLQSRQMTNQSDSVYKSLNPNTNQSDSVYQNLNPNTNQSDSVYQSLNPNTNQSDSVYQSLKPNTSQSDSVYQSLNPNTNQSDSVYQSLNPNTNQSDSVYQSLNPNTNQSDSVYQSMNPNTNQSDSVYHSLNPNTNQSDSVYQSLNPNTNQSDSVYQSLNPNTNQSDSVYQSLKY
ncbi:polymeric immunoglobulin receptor-like [Ictalurus furcatus]|uniref:polymeric immunoglobulin receptor-like n=1 Tax=Ictalurus furcatus TaxID=66913 RepID=UPI002350D059|nr:polymeric immunoglobulin receptor-like [Ictalurus furcatus]